MGLGLVMDDIQHAYCPAGSDDRCPIRSAPNLDYSTLPVPAPGATPPPEDCASSGCMPANCGTTGALASCLQPTQSARAYLRQADLYFNSVDPELYNPLDSPTTLGYPNYSPTAMRWEWPPWLLLTAFTKDQFIVVDGIDRKESPFSVPKVNRECKYYNSSPFVRCAVNLWSTGVNRTTLESWPTSSVTCGCTIWEEFTFNNDGEVTFVEAWSHSLPKSARMSARIPGLGQPSGAIDPNDGVVWDPIAAVQPDVATLHARAQNLVTQGASIALTYSSLNGMEGSGVEWEMIAGCAVDSAGAPLPTIIASESAQQAA
ncbi:hypothetical protein T492DRAFT_1042876 [Pavlovales sp. CCMP2436]|nr:hypothetical protein T492DRAFT_1042876 [Pavlovales sp. CCMP2436]